jgi:hypothetical protein
MVIAHQTSHHAFVEILKQRRHRFHAAPTRPFIYAYLWLSLQGPLLTCSEHAGESCRERTAAIQSTTNACVMGESGDTSAMGRPHLAALAVARRVGPEDALGALWHLVATAEECARLLSASASGHRSNAPRRGGRWHAHTSRGQLERRDCRKLQPDEQSDQQTSSHVWMLKRIPRHFAFLISDVQTRGESRATAGGCGVWWCARWLHVCTFSLHVARLSVAENEAWIDWASQPPSPPWIPPSVRPVLPPLVTPTLTVD